MQQDSPRATWCQPALCSGWLAQMCQDQSGSEMSLTREGCATNMDEKDMEAREGGSKAATPSLRDTAEQFTIEKKKKKNTCVCSKHPEEVLGHLSFQHTASIWGCHVAVFSPRNWMLRLSGSGLLEPLVKTAPQSLGQSECVCYNLQWQQITINPLGFDDTFPLRGRGNALLLTSG